ncbi:GL21857 [Drosophila persimilis]|uniref:GL21857 n=1 Tax=Drosophila persimilis TaxID=7234 RepID=B4GEA6_DROPE|nr:GL21857 [Drosophila persimilis]
MRCVTLVLLYLHTVWAALRNQTELSDKSVALQDVLLSRRVRGLVFPDKASLLLTAALTKIIVGGRPSGLQYSLEFDMYIPLPDTVEGWQPKILKRLRPKPSTQRRWDWYDNQGWAKYTDITHTPIHRTVPYSSFQLDIRSCIKRAMCELRSRLNGGFLMEDLVRIILTVPDEVTDGKYRHRMDIRDCAHFYALSCPYRVLDFLTQNMNKYRTQ